MVVNANKHDAAERFLLKNRQSLTCYRKTLMSLMRIKQTEPAPPADVPMADILPGTAASCLKIYGLA